MLMGLQHESIRQLALFDAVDPANAVQVMGTLDRLNQRFGRGTLRLASEGVRPRGWVMRADSRTPAYTTRWEDVPLARA